MKNLIFVFFFVVSFIVPIAAQENMMAVIDVQIQGEAKKFISLEEQRYLSSAIRGQASHILGNKFQILSQANYKKLVKANADGCSEAGCFAGFIAEIGVDLGVQPTITYAFGKLKMTIEVADKVVSIGTRTMSVPPTEDGKNELGELAEQNAKELFFEVAQKLSVPITTPKVNENISNSKIEEKLSEIGETTNESINDGMNQYADPIFEQPITKEEAKVEPIIEPKFERSLFTVQAVMGFTSISEGGAGIRVGLNLGRITLYSGIGLFSIINNFNDVTVLPVIGLGYTFNRNMLCIQTELYYSHDSTTDYETSYVPFVLQYHRDIGKQGAWSAILGIGVAELSDDSYDSGYGISSYVPTGTIGLAYEF